WRSESADLSYQTFRYERPCAWRDTAGGSLSSPLPALLNCIPRQKSERKIDTGSCCAIIAAVRRPVCVLSCVEPCRTFALHRLAGAANERYLEALSVVGEPSSARDLLDPLTRRITKNARCYRGLHPFEPDDARLFSLLQDGQFHVQGFRNRDLRPQLF